MLNRHKQCELFKFRACSEPEVFQRHLQESTDFEGTINAHDKVCMECYRHSLIISRIKRENPISSDTDFHTLLSAIQNTVPSLPFSITTDCQLLDIATKLTIIQVAQEQLNNHALTLRDAYHYFESHVVTLLPMSTLTNRPERLGSEGWLVSCVLHFSITCPISAG